MSAGFGNAGTLWSSGRHTGQDFAAPMGTPVRAAAAGRVSIEQSSWAGQLVRIDHGGGLETLYAHMSRVDVASGATPEAGDRTNVGEGKSGSVAVDLGGSRHNKNKKH